MKVIWENSCSRFLPTTFATKIENMEEEEFRVIITGCWDFTDYNLLCQKCDRMLSEKVKTHKVIVVSGHEKGTDALGEKYAKERKFRIEKYPADRSRGRLSGTIRNEQMARVADALIVFWDGRFHETRNMIDFANLKGIPVKVLRIDEISAKDY